MKLLDTLGNDFDHKVLKWKAKLANELKEFEVTIDIHVYTCIYIIYTCVHYIGRHL